MKTFVAEAHFSCSVQEFDLEIMDRKGCEDQVTDHLLHLKAYSNQMEKVNIQESFLDEHMIMIKESLLIS